MTKLLSLFLWFCIPVRPWPLGIYTQWEIFYSKFFSRGKGGAGLEGWGEEGRGIIPSSVVMYKVEKSFVLKGLSPEIDFQNVDKNWQILALIRAAASFWIFRRNLWFLVEIKHLLSGKCWNHAYSLCNPINFVTELLARLPNMNISDVGLFKGKLRSQTFFEVPPDSYCTSVKLLAYC
jgi:hypothetical protein